MLCAGVGFDLDAYRRRARAVALANAPVRISQKPLNLASASTISWPLNSGCDAEKARRTRSAEASGARIRSRSTSGGVMTPVRASA